MTDEEPFVEVENPATRLTYRFYGRGVWKIKDRDGWRAINGIYVPEMVLKIAADHSRPTPA